MSFKRSFTDLSIQELYQKLRRVIYYFEEGEPLTDEKLDLYLLLKNRIEFLERNLPDKELTIEQKWKRLYEE